MLKTYKYKIIPNKQQEELLNKFFGCVRFIYNWGLEQKTSSYKEFGKSIDYGTLAKKLTELKHNKEYNWLKECTNEALQQSLRNLETAFTAFFRKKANYPKFKSKKHSRNSVKFINCVHFDFDNWTVKLPKLGKVKLCKNRTFDKSNCKQGTCTVVKDHVGTYWCTVIIDDLISYPVKAKLDKEKAVGLDIGIKDYAVLSNGFKFQNPKYLEKCQLRLSHLQKVFARTLPGSRNHEKMRIKVAKCHRSIVNKKTDYLHKMTSYLITNYDTICLETLNINGLLKNSFLSKSIYSASWNEFIRQLRYKSEWRGKNIVFIGRFEPSSKLCHKCGYVYKDLKLSDRKWICPNCRESHDRDINAAINIKEIAFDRQNLIGLNKINNKNIIARRKAGVETVEGRGYEPNEAVTHL